MEQEQSAKQHGKAILSDLYKEIWEVKASSAKLENRLERIESALEGLSRSMKSLIPDDASVERDLETVDKYITEYIQSHEAEEEQEIDSEKGSINWNYFVAKKGGYDEVLYISLQDILCLGDDSVRFLEFLLEKRRKEIEEGLKHLQEEFRKQDGNQLQQHFKNLWELHHELLKKKMVRTWKEEVFLESFEAFIGWMQQ